jgi:hypothetical protein
MVLQKECPLVDYSDTLDPYLIPTAALAIGKHVQLSFISPYGSNEHMWVEITRAPPTPRGNYIGRLVNFPLEEYTGLSQGDKIRFKPENICRF